MSSAGELVAIPVALSSIALPEGKYLKDRFARALSCHVMSCQINRSYLIFRH